MAAMDDRSLTWLMVQNSTPYRMQLSADCTDNPDQRIAEDIKLFVSNTLSLVTGLLGSVLTLGSFIVILWGLSNAAPLTLFGHAVGVPGYLVWSQSSMQWSGLRSRIGSGGHWSTSTLSSSATRQISVRDCCAFARTQSRLRF